MFVFSKFLIIFFIFNSQAHSKENTNCQSPSLIRTAKKTNGLRHSLAKSSFSVANFAEPKVLIKSRNIFKKSQELILQAKKQILFQTWMFQAHSDPAHSLFKGLARLQKKMHRQGRHNRPIDVWLLINVLPWNNKKDQVSDILKLKRRHRIAKRYIRLHIGIWDTKNFDANHAKTLSVDGRTLLMTGANITTKNNFNSSYFDLGFVFKGSVVNQIDRNFRSAWKRTIVRNNCEPSNGFMGAGDPNEIFKEFNCWNRSKKLPKRMKVFKMQGPHSCLPILLVQNQPRANPFASIAKSSQNKALLSAILKAQRSIDIMTPNLNVPIVIKSLLKAANRGVKVRIVLSKGHESFNQSLPSRGGSNQISINKMSQSTNRTLCRNMNIRWYSHSGRKAALGSEPPTSHAKYLVIDDQITYVGSANLDIQSWVNSREVGLLIDNPSLSIKWKKQIFSPVYARSIKTNFCR